MSHSLDLDIAYFNAHIERLRADAERAGQPIVLIYDREPCGFFPTIVEAAQAGYERFSPDTFLVRDVAPTQHQAAIASLFTSE